MALPEMSTLRLDKTLLADVKPHAWRQGVVSLTFEIPCDVPCPPIPTFMHYKEETRSAPCSECKAMLKALAEWQAHVTSLIESNKGAYFSLDVVGYSMMGERFTKHHFDAPGTEFNGWELSARTPDGESVQVILPDRYGDILNKNLNPERTPMTRLERLLDPKDPLTALK